MAIQITAKDRLFVMVVLPVALALGYCYLVRKPVVTERHLLESRKMALGETSDLDFQKMALQRRAMESEALYREILARPAETNALPIAESDFAARLKTVLGAFEKAGALVMKSEPVAEQDGNAEKGLAAEILGKAVPSIAVRRWRFELKATYGDLTRALSGFVADDVAVVCESLDMTAPSGAGLCNWTVTLCL